MAYFDAQPAEQPDVAGRFDTPRNSPSVEMVPGVFLRPVLGESILVSFVEFAPNAVAPLHAHVEEQVVVVLEGELRFVIGEETQTMRPGDVALIPPWVRHGGMAGPEGCKEIDIFNPPREGLVEVLNQRTLVTNDPLRTEGD